MAQTFQTPPWGRALAAWRHWLGISQTELGKLIGVGYRGVAGWERGRAWPTMAHTRRLIRLGAPNPSTYPGSRVEKTDAELGRAT